MLRSVVALIFAALASQAVAQSAILQGGPWAAGRAPMYADSGNSQPVLLDSGPASGGSLGTGLNELGLQVRGLTTPPIANGGTGPNGENLCDYDAPIDNADGYHYLCLSPNAQGGGLLSYGAAGAADVAPLNVMINGVLTAFPSGGGGSSTVFHDGLTATGTNQATALLVSGTTNGFTTVGSGTGSLLPVIDTSGQPLTGGYDVEVLNSGANVLAVYPPTGQTIEGQSANASVTVYMNGDVHFTYRGAGAWYAR